MHIFKVTTLILFMCLFNPSVAQQNPPVYVIVHGAWGGSWAFKEVDQLLTVKGNTVYRPSLTGQGERVHLANESVGLETHIMDVVNTLLFEELDNIILVGHSYGGMVVTGVADRLPERIQKLVYLDAFVPENNESVNEIFVNDPKKYNIVDGGIVPSWISENQTPPSDVPHPYKTFTDRIVLKKTKRMEIETHYIHTVEKGKTPESDDFVIHANRAKQKNWPVYILESDHNPQWSAPIAFVELLKKIEEK
ncbi:MAG: alpha/beta fold hydrolase [Flavobacteriaceae bacterium TMED42]|nr:MAG: alpha/beta fold hydrolase [Flavobacteriaceae bacterium TMED42]|tara:strand:- start:357 stop:1106 length:750 start_codon:yes stop_codon:yes gene_type:complete